MRGLTWMGHCNPDAKRCRAQDFGLAVARCRHFGIFPLSYYLEPNTDGRGVDFACEAVFR